MSTADGKGHRTVILLAVSVVIALMAVGTLVNANAHATPSNAISAATAPPPLGGVAVGTMIISSTGYVPVQSLHTGSVVEEYLVAQHTFVGGLVLSVTPFTAPSMLVVNHNGLLVSLTGVPLYVKSNGATGWLTDAQSLLPGMSLFNPATGLWTPVLTVQVVHPSVTLVHLVITGTGGFVANGALVS